MGSVRLNCQFCLKTGCPDGISITGDDGIGEGAAATELLLPKENAESDLIYLLDSGVVKLLTDLLDLPAQLIAELYKHRWEIELFFRWLKVTANFGHLTSHSRNGVTLSFHIARQMNRARQARKACRKIIHLKAAGPPGPRLGRVDAARMVFQTRQNQADFFKTSHAQRSVTAAQG